MANNIYTNFFSKNKKLAFAILTSILLLFTYSTVRAEDRRIVTVFVEGTEMAIPTTAKTVGEALDRIGVKVFDNDLVEPAIDEEIIADTFNINVYRARPVTVIDGENKFVVMSPYQSPRRIAEGAGLKIYDEDTFEEERITDFVANGALGKMLYINRAQPLTLNLYGNSIKVRTQAKTVSELLSEKGIRLAKSDTVKPAKNTKLFGLQSVFVLRTGTEVISEDVAIDFPIEVIKDTAKEIGYSEIRTAGTPGSKTITYEITKENGVEVKRRILQEVVTKEAKKQVVVEGAKAAPLPATGISGTKEDWMRAAGIPESDWQYVDFIVGRESGWNPTALNPYSGACGLAQALPCSKVGAGATDPVAALQWQHSYVNGRYGGYAGAYAFWSANHWY